MRAVLRATIAVVAVACTYSVPNVIVRSDGGPATDDAGLDAPADAVGIDADVDAGVDATVDVDAAIPDAALPGPLTTDLSLHLRADDLTLADGARVASWADVAGMSFALLQSDNAKRPLFRARAATEPNAVEFLEQTHVALDPSASASFRYAAGVSFAVAAVFKTSVTTTERFEQIVGNEFAGSANRVGFVLDVDSQTGAPIFGIHQGCDGGCTAVTGQSSVNNGKWHWVLGVREGDTARLYVDGASDGMLASGAGVSLAAADDLRVGASAFNALPFVGRVAEVFVWQRSLSSVDVQALDTHLRSRFPIAQ